LVLVLAAGARARALLGKVGRARTLVENCGPRMGRKRMRKFRAAGKQLAAFTRLVNRGQTQGKIAGPLATGCSASSRTRAAAPGS
jgi:hypothetical protein